MGTMKKIVILHGWAHEHTKWVPFVNQLIRQGFDIKLLNIPGLTAPLNEIWKLDNYVQWLHENLFSENEPVVLLGHSNGGRIALAYCAKYLQKISHLILIDSAGIYHKELTLRLKRFIFGIFARIGKKLTSSPTLRRILYRLAGETDYYQANPIMRQTMINLSFDLTHILPRIHVPTLIIWGRQDKITPLSDSKKMHNLIKNSTLHIVDGAHHSPQFTHKEEVTKIIKQSLDT